MYALQVPYGYPLLPSYWWSVSKTAKVCVSEVRVLWLHSAAWIAVDTLAAFLVLALLPIEEYGRDRNVDVNGRRTLAIQADWFVAFCVRGRRVQSCRDDGWGKGREGRKRCDEVHLYRCILVSDPRLVVLSSFCCGGRSSLYSCPEHPYVP